MKILSLFTLSLIFSLFELKAQNSDVNPFEIPSRMEKYSTVKEPTDTILNNNQSIIVDSITKTDGSKMSDMNDFDSNPFEVSHVPIRKSTNTVYLKQEPSPQVDVNTRKNSKALPVTKNNFIFYVLLMSLALLGIVLGNKISLLPNMVKSVMNENLLKLTKREENSGFNLHHFLLYLVLLINLSIFIFLLLRNRMVIDGMTSWLWILLALASIYFVKHFVLYIMGNIFPISKSISLYSFSILVFNILIGICLIPVNFILAYAPPEFFNYSLYLGFAMILILLALRYLRGIFISANFVVSNLFLFFLYLCTLEIAPIMILWRFISLM